VVAGMPFFTLHRIHLLLTNRGLLYRIHSRFYRVYIHSTPSIVSVVKHYLPPFPNTPGPPKRAWPYAHTPHHPGSPPPLARASGTFWTSMLDWEWVGTVGHAKERGKRGGQTRVGGGGQCVLRPGGCLMSLSPFYLVASVHCDG
jgi:hypothetical protein